MLRTYSYALYLIKNLCIIFYNIGLDDTTNAKAAIDAAEASRPCRIGNLFINYLLLFWNSLF